MNLDLVLEEWATSTVETKKAAARTVADLIGMRPGTVVPSKEKMADKLGIHPSMAQRIRGMLQSTGIVYKSGRHLYLSDKLKSIQGKLPVPMFGALNNDQLLDAYRAASLLQAHNRKLGIETLADRLYTLATDIAAELVSRSAPVNIPANAEDRLPWLQ